MRVALVGAEFEENLALRYLWSALERAGHEVVQVVFNEEGERERAARELAASGAELAGLSMVFTYRAREFAALASRARELGYCGHLVAGGHFAAFNADALLRDVPAFDSVAIGEGEGILVELAAHRDDLAAVRGLVWRRADGPLVSNPPAVKPPDLDALPHPTHKRPFDTYLGMPIVNVLASRGCTHACAFCSIAAWHRLCGGERFRRRRPARVADEMAELYHQGVRIFNFHDDNFLLQSPAASLARLHALQHELEARGVGRIAFAIKARPDSVDEAVFATLKRMGLFRVFLGIEAGTAESLRRLGRGQTRDDNERALALVNRLDIHACFNLLILNPDSTLEDVAANLAFLRQHPQNPLNFCRTEVYAGTPLEARLRHQGRLLGDYWGYDYVIADPRAQLLFEIVFPVFRERNYGPDGLHHKTMGVDYAHQLLAHFFGVEERLRRRVKDYVVAVNRNTCAHLERIVDAVRGGLSRGEAASVVSAMAAAVRADNAQLGAEGDDLLDEIRRRASAKAGEVSRRQVLQAAAAGLAAGVAVAVAGCEDSTHPTEVAASPPKRDPESIREEKARATTAPSGGPPRPTPPPEEPSAKAPAAKQPAEKDKTAKAEPLNIEKDVVRPFVAWALPFLAPRITPAKDIEVELQINEAGKVARWALRGAKLTPEDERAFEERLKTVTFREETRSKSLTIPIKKAEMEATLKPPPPPEPPKEPPKPPPPKRPPTQIFEMVPHPPEDLRRPHTQPHERAPMPPRPPKVEER